MRYFSNSPPRQNQKNNSARIHSPDPFLRAESKPEFSPIKLAEVLRILSPENCFAKPIPYCCLEAYHTFLQEKLCAPHRGALARGMPHSSPNFFWKKVRANDIMTPPKETSAKLEMRSDFSGAKIALSFFSKPFPPTAEVNSQSSTQLIS